MLNIGSLPSQSFTLILILRYLPSLGALGVLQPRSKGSEVVVPTGLVPVYLFWSEIDENPFKYRTSQAAFGNVQRRTHI